MKVKCLSLHQPWADRIVRGEKTIETRVWATGFRGWLLICSSKTPKVAGSRSGVALAFVLVTDCRPMVKEDEAAACCEIYPDAQAWILVAVRPLNRPFKVNGFQRIYEIDVPETALETVGADGWSYAEHSTH